MKDFDRKAAEDILQGLLDLMDSKNEDYSGDNVAIYGLDGILSRLLDKVIRARSINRSGKANNESMTDTLNDLINYGLMGRMVQEGQWLRSTHMVYLAGPIDDVDKDTADVWRIKASAFLNEHGISVFNPAYAYSLAWPAADNTAEVVSAINRFAIGACSCVLANLQGAGKALGTIREIEYARALNKRVVVVGSVGEHIEARDLEVHLSFRTALTAIAGAEPEVENNFTTRHWMAGMPTEYRMVGVDMAMEEDSRTVTHVVGVFNKPDPDGDILEKDALDEYNRRLGELADDHS